MVALTKQADNRMQDTPASVKASILKAGFVLAPILLMALFFYFLITIFIPSGYYEEYIFGWAFMVLAIQVVVLLWVRTFPALASLIMSMLVSFTVLFADSLTNLSYLGFVMANSPLEQYKDRCVIVPYFDGRAETLGYCQTFRRAGHLFSEDIMMDSGGWIMADGAKRPRAWNKAFSTLTTTATHSQLFQVNMLEDVNDSLMQVDEIGHGFFRVSYSDGEDY